MFIVLFYKKKRKIKKRDEKEDREIGEGRER